MQEKPARPCFRNQATRRVSCCRAFAAGASVCFLRWHLGSRSAALGCGHCSGICHIRNRNPETQLIAMRMYVFVRAGVLAGVVAVGASAPKALGATNVVGVRGPTSYVFVPNTVSITVGDTVLWTNQSSTTHDITEGSFPGGATSNPYWPPRVLGLLATFSVTFSNVGTYPYICNQHVFVTPQPPTGTPTQTGMVTVAAFNFPPSVNLTSPSDGASVVEPGSFTMSAEAADSDGT